MTVNTKGFEYEQVVIDALASAGYVGNITEGAGASAADADADFRLHGNTHLVEIKLDSKAQMGGSSVKYVAGEFTLVKPSEPALDAALISAVRSKEEQLVRLLERISELEGKKIDKYSMQCSKEHWSLLQKEGFLVNVKIDAGIDYIIKHYNSKGVNYIQFGDAGLYYLKNNPAELDIPKLSGSVKLEVRTARGGSKVHKNGERRITGAIRVQARLKLDRGSKSRYTLDNPESVRDLFSEAGRL